MSFKKAPFFFLALFIVGTATAQTDTLRIMAYNVLNYGNGCQYPNTTLHQYLKTIIKYTNPDVVSLEKMASIKTSSTDMHSIMPYGFADSVLDSAFNNAFVNRYTYCPWTNVTQADNISIIFYDKKKLTYVSSAVLEAYITDFTMYKFYYNDPKLSTTHDTTWLYFIPNHDQSGNSSAERDTQLTHETLALHAKFTHLPNIFTMGDFNLRNTYEATYQVLTNPADTDFRFYDAPFTVDSELTYPANWDVYPVTYAPYLTTSTRALATVPNSCGTSGGAKDWYDHIFMSRWIVSGSNYVQYIPKSYRTIGNDGHRVGYSVNDSAMVKNTSAPADVINAIFHLSNKYPIMADLLVTSNTTGTSPADPDITTAVNEVKADNGHASLVNPVDDNMVLYFSPNLAGRTIHIVCYDALGRRVMNIETRAAAMNNFNCPLDKGVYYLKIYNQDGLILNRSFVKK